MISSSRLAPARRRRRPAHQGHLANWPPLPSLAGAPPKGSPCGTTVQPAGCLAWAVPPGRGSRPPHAGRRSAQWARDTAMPPQSPCRNSACMPASRGSHCAPAPRARPSSPLPGPSSPVLPLYIPSDPCCVRDGECDVKVYKKLSKNALHYGVGPCTWTAQFSADLLDQKAELGATPSPGPTLGAPRGGHPAAFLPPCSS